MKILTQAQAEAVYSAMCALNNIGANICGDISLDNCEVRVSRISGEISVRGRKLAEREIYEGQYQFAAAYGLSSEVAA